MPQAISHNQLTISRLYIAGIFHEFEVIAGFFVVKELRACFRRPYRRVYHGEECVGIFDDRMHMGDYEPVGIIQRLCVDLAAADDEASGIPDRVGNDRGSGRYRSRRSRYSGRSGPVGLFKRQNNLNPFRGIKTPGNDDIRAFRERTADGFESPAAHYDRTARSRAFEELQIFGNVPEKGIVPAYRVIVRDSYYNAFFHGYTATGAGMRGYGS